MYILALLIRIGASLYDNEGAKLVTDIMAKAKAKNVTIHLPIDFRTGAVSPVPPSVT